MNIIFFGTSEFAVPALHALVKKGLAPRIVVTLPDRPQGRGLHLIPSPVKVAAQQHGILTLQPEKINDAWFMAKMLETPYDLGVVASYGKLIPARILEIPKHGFLNIHPSLLPDLRGPSPIEYAILEGKQETGVSIMQLDAEMDHGPILKQQKIAISPEETSASLEMKCGELGGEILANAISGWLDGTLQAKDQDHSEATFSKKITKEDGHIIWNEPADSIDRKIRAFTPWPSAYTFWQRQKEAKPLRLKILKAKIIAEEKNDIIPGLVEKHDGDMIITCGKNALSILEIQPEGKKIMTQKEFLQGYHDSIGAIFH